MLGRNSQPHGSRAKASEGSGCLGGSMVISHRKGCNETQVKEI